MKRSRTKLVTLVLCGVAGLFAALVGFGSAATTQAVTTKTTTIVVLAGKPSELAFKVSKNSLIAPGTVIFKVTNAGRIPHDFRICVTPISKATNSCAKGRQTPLLAPGKSATIKILLTKKGTYEYLCTLPGHASAGMKGLVGIGVKYVPPIVVSTTHTTTSHTTTTVTTTTSPATTTTGTTTTSPTTTTTPTTTAASNDGCPAGQTIVTSGNTDNDGDEGGAPSDMDGCI